MSERHRQMLIGLSYAQLCDLRDAVLIKMKETPVSIASASVSTNSGASGMGQASVEQRKQAPFVVDGYAPFDGDVVYFGQGQRAGPGLTGPFPRSLAVVVYNAENDFWAIHSVTSEAAWRLNPDRCREALKRHQANIAIQHGLGLVDFRPI